SPDALPGGFGNVDTYIRLGQLYKQINAPVGQFGLATLRASTAGLESGTPQNDSVFTTATQRLTELGGVRDQLAAEMSEVLDRSVSSAPSGAGPNHAGGGLQAQALDLL